MATRFIQTDEDGGGYNIDDESGDIFDTSANKVELPQIPEPTSTPTSESSGLMGPVDLLGAAGGGGNTGGTSFADVMGAVLETTGIGAHSNANTLANATGSPVAAASGSSNWFDSIMTSIGGSIKKDPMKLLELGLGAVGGAYKDEGVKRAAALKREQQLEDQAAFNQSVVGMRPARKGIIQGALKRINGQQVFNADGTYNKA